MRVLVIRLGAFGDFVQSFGPFAAIRAAHPGDEITLLTTAPYAGMARESPWFDHVEIDRRPGWWNLPGWLALRRQLQGFDLVYDLQTSGRSSRYFRLAGRPRWSGIAAGCALPHDNPKRDSLHTFERQREQLERAGITEFPVPDLSWLPPAPVALPRRYSLLVPGASLRRPRKRWPAENFGLLARMLWERGATPVLVGGPDDADIGELIRLFCPQTVDLIGRTTLGEIAAVARGACICVGNDTGPMHLAALTGSPCLVLFGRDSNPDITAPRGPDGEWSSVLQIGDLKQLPAEEVFEKVTALMRPTWA